MPDEPPDGRDGGAVAARLDASEVAIRARIAALEDGFDGIVEAASDVATDDEHDPEGHTIAWEHQQLAGLLDEARRTLHELDSARQRVGDGTYGRCVTCGRDIAPGRLEALPATPTCIDCTA